MNRTVPALCFWRWQPAPARKRAAARKSSIPQEAKELAHALDGKVAGKPVACVSSFRGNNLHAIGDHTLVYRVSKKLTYRNDLQGACHGLRFGDTLVLKVSGDQYCRGDIAHAVEPAIGAPERRTARWAISCPIRHGARRPTKGASCRTSASMRPIMRPDHMPADRLLGRHHLDCRW